MQVEYVKYKSTITGIIEAGEGMSRDGMYDIGDEEHLSWMDRGNPICCPECDAEAEIVEDEGSYYYTFPCGCQNDCY